MPFTDSAASTIAQWLHLLGSDFFSTDKQKFTGQIYETLGWDLSEAPQNPPKRNCGKCDYSVTMASYTKPSRNKF